MSYVFKLSLPLCHRLSHQFESLTGPLNMKTETLPFIGTQVLNLTSYKKNHAPEPSSLVLNQDPSVITCQSNLTSPSCDGDLILSCKVLRGSGGEGLREVDAAEPKHHRGTIVHPLPGGLVPVMLAVGTIIFWFHQRLPHFCPGFTMVINLVVSMVSPRIPAAYYHRKSSRQPTSVAEILRTSIKQINCHQSLSF